MMSFLNLFDDILNKNQERYRLVTTLEGHGGPINTFSVSASGSLLASGGDDEEVRIWDINKLSRCQTLIDPANQWGQITAVKFIKFDSNTIGSEWLCFGTGRGQFLVYRKGRKTTEFIECLSMRVFSSGDGVEAFAFDQYHQRFALSSHYGKVKMFRFEKGNLVELWADEFIDAIPRAILFTDKGQDVSIFGMENGTIYYRDAETSNAKSTRVLKTPIGNVSTCPMTANILIDNMRDGFDLYAPNRAVPIRSFRFHSTKKYVKGGVFGEDGKIVICGSDHGKVYIFGVNDEEPIQELLHGNRQQMIQAVQAITANDYHFIVSGASDGRCDITIWKKPIRGRIRESEKLDVAGTLLISNIFFVIIFAWMTQDMWFSPIRDNLSLMSARLASSKSFVLEKQVAQVQVLPTIDEILNSMDDATLRKLLGVSSLTFSESEHQTAVQLKEPAADSKEEVEELKHVIL